MRIFSWIVLMIVLISTPAGMALAQGEPPAYCGQLSPEDCAILTGAQEAMLALSSTRFGADITYALTSSDPEMDAMSFAISMNGQLTWEPSLLQPYAALNLSDPAGMMNILTTAPETFVEFLRSLAGEFTVQMTMPPEMLTELDTAEMPPTVLRLVDDVWYLNMGTIVDATDDANFAAPSWLGLDLATMYEHAFSAMADRGDEQEGLSELLASDTFVAMMDPAFWSEFATVVRLPDEAIDGRPVAVFQVALDYGAMVNSELFHTAMGEYMGFMMDSMGFEDADLSGPYREAMTAMLNSTTFTFEQWIGLEDGYLHRMTVDMGFNMEIAKMMSALVPDEDMGDVPDQIGMSMALTLNLSAFNEPVEVTAPENAQVINPLMFMSSEMFSADND